MPERVTITNYTDKPLAHPGFTTIMPGQTKTRTQRVVDVDSYSEVYDRMASAGIHVRFADTVPQGVVEPTANATLTPTQRLAVVKAGGTTVTLPKLSDVPVGKPSCF